VFHVLFIDIKNTFFGFNFFPADFYFLKTSKEFQIFGYPFILAYLKKKYFSFFQVPLTNKIPKIAFSKLV